MAKKTLGEMVWSFATELTTHAKGGFAHVDPVTYSRRISICIDCPLFAKESPHCTKCGCNMEVKAKWATSRCPLNPPLWDRELKEDDSNKDGDNPTVSDQV